MARDGRAGGGGAGDGSNVPKESVELEGNIVSAAKSTFEPKSYERGYPEAEGSLHMRNIGGSKPK